MWTSFKPIDTSKEIFETAEQAFNDDIYNSGGQMISNASHLSDNKFYKRPDYTYSVFSTMGEGLYSLLSNNMLAPIRVNHELNRFGNYVLDNTKNYKDRSGGVYIIEEIYIHQPAYRDFEKLVKYYQNRNRILSNDPNTWLRFTAELNEQIHSRTPTFPVKLRLCTFVHKTDIDKYIQVYIPNMDICISKGIPVEGSVHPRSTEANSSTMEDTLLSERSHTSITIDIIDNENPGRPYFTKIGHNVIRVFSTSVKDKLDGGLIQTKVNDTVSDKIVIPELSKLSEHGFYRTEEEALTEGNLEFLIQKENNEITRSKLKHENLKMVMSEASISNKMLHEVTMQNYDIKKKDIELNMLFLKNSMELRKYVSDINKLESESKKLDLEDKTNTTKNISNITQLLGLVIATASKFVK